MEGGNPTGARSGPASQRSRGLWTLGPAITLGWILHDLAFIGTGGEPHLAIRILPGSAAAVGLGVLLGLSCTRWRFLSWCLVGAAGVGALLQSGEPALLESCGRRFRSGLPLLPHAVLLLFGGAAVAAALSRRTRFAPVATAMGIGAMSSASLALVRFGANPLSAVVFSCSLLALVAGWLRPSRGRTAALAVFALAPLLVVLVMRVEQTRLPREDRALGATPRGKGRPNLVMVTLDTVRCDHLASYGYHRVTTPGLDRFAGEHAVRYANARSTSSWTLPSHGSLFTGLYPSEHGATLPRVARGGHSVPGSLWPAERLRADATTLAERLAGDGFRTAAIVSNSAYLAHSFGLDRGFHHYDDRLGTRLSGPFALGQFLGFHRPVGVLGYRDARTITDLAIEWLEESARGTEFFLFVNYMDAHSPYLPPAPFDRAFAPERPVDPLDPAQSLWSLLYDRELLYLDHHLTRLLDWMDDHGVLENTVVIITSDHGEAFGEHGFWAHGSTLYEEVVCVPLYVKRVGWKGSDVATGFINGAGVYGLALRELGIEGAPEESGDGIIGEWYGFGDRPRRKTDFPVRVEQNLVAWMEGSLKVIVSSRGDVEVYDLEADPGEDRNLAAELGWTERARATAARWWAAHPPLAERGGKPVDPETLERLRRLGYADE